MPFFGVLVEKMTALVYLAVYLVVDQGHLDPPERTSMTVNIMTLSVRRHTPCHCAGDRIAGHCTS